MNAFILVGPLLVGAWAMPPKPPKSGPVRKLNGLAT